MRWFLIILLLAIGALVAYVRLAPTSVADVHVAGAPLDPGDYPAEGGFTAVRALTTPPEGAMTAVEAAAAGWPRTRLIAGSVSEGMMTFETRTKWMGFPDYTTVSIIETGAAPSGNPAPLLMITGRLRFGQSDLGVNRARIENWLEQLGPLVSAP